MQLALRPDPKSAPTSVEKNLRAMDPDLMNVVPLQRKVTVINPNGLHMRPSAEFVKLAGQFQSRVTVSHDGKTVNGKSILDLFLLLAMPGSELTLEASGPDAPQALDALATLLSTPPTPES